MSRDRRIREMLRDLQRSLCDAISSSSEVGRTVRRIRDEGYALRLTVDCKRTLEPEERLAAATPRLAASEPRFQINGNDLSFLKSIGIDPTRQLRRRRSH